MNMNVSSAAILAAESSGFGAAAGFKVDLSRGERVSRVSSEWFSRPADERYLSLSELFGAVYGRTERSRTRMVESAAIRVEASRDDSEKLALMLPGRTRLSRRRIGALVNSRVSSARRRHICVSFLRRSPASICNMG